MPRKRRAVDEVTKPETVETLDRAGPGKRDRSWDKARVPDKATYLIGRKLKRRLKEIAMEHNKSVSLIAQRFLEYALDAYERGDLQWIMVEVQDTDLQGRGK